MHLSKALLQQARELVELDKTRPKQVNLRRAISSAYYAVFPLLVTESVHRLYPRNPDIPRKRSLPDPGPLKDRMNRAFQHAEMKQICRQFQQKQLPDALAILLGNGVSLELQAVTKAFLELQEERHTADYDLGQWYRREDAEAVVATAERAFQQWSSVPEPEANVFAAALAFGARWSK